MATYIETLKRGDDQIIPRTTTAAITTSDGTSLEDKIAEKYVKPSSGIPASDINVVDWGSKADKNNGTVISDNADFAEIGEWHDGNPTDENRIGYFVTLTKTIEGFVIDKATATSDVCGVIVTSPAFSGNADDKYDANGNLKKQYDYVALLGLVSVIDNGTCTVPGKCMPTTDGTAVPSTNNMGFNVISRIDSTHIEVFIRPGADMLQRIRSDVLNLETSKVDKVNGKGLSTNDYTTEEKNKLAELENYDDTEIQQSVSNKLDKNQGVNNAGKVLQVGTNGLVGAVEPKWGFQYTVIEIDPSEWDSGVYTKEISGLKVESDFTQISLVTPVSSCITEYNNARIHQTCEVANTLKLVCEYTPTTVLKAVVTIFDNGVLIHDGPTSSLVDYGKVGSMVVE